MPKKKTVSQEELEQAAARLPEQAEADAAIPLDVGLPDDGPPTEGQETEAVHTPEVMEVGVDAPAEPPESTPGDDPVEGSPLEDPPSAAGQGTAEELPPDPAAVETPPMTDCQSFFALDFRELDRDLSPEERQAWNSIYASFRGRSALSGKIIGADPHSMNVRNRETGLVERRTMYCVVVLLYRVPVYIPATEMWMGEARPDYVLQNMMGAGIDFIITKVDREGGYAIASRRQAARAQRYFFAHGPICAGRGPGSSAGCWPWGPGGAWWSAMAMILISPSGS